MNILLQEKGVENLSQNWRDAMRSQQDPLAIWKTNFETWRNSFTEFRKSEKEIFFADTENLLSQRFHRSWTCQLIAIGEKLAADLMSCNVGEERAREEQLRQIDSFLNNLRETFETWHSLDREKVENKLSVFLK
jgi:hypothetical protein